MVLVGWVSQVSSNFQFVEVFPRFLQVSLGAASLEGLPKLKSAKAGGKLSWSLYGDAPNYIIFVGTISGGRKRYRFDGASMVAINVVCNLKNVVWKKRRWFLRLRPSSQFYRKGPPKLGPPDGAKFGPGYLRATKTGTVRRTQFGVAFLKKYELERDLKSHPRFFHNTSLKLQNILKATREDPLLAAANFPPCLASEMVPCGLDKIEIRNFQQKMYLYWCFEKKIKEITIIY